MAKEVTPILTKQSTHTGIMRGRDVRKRLQYKDLDPELRAVVEELAEINHTNCQAIVELASMQAKLLDLIQHFADISQNMKDKMAQIERSTSATAEDDGEDTKH